MTSVSPATQPVFAWPAAWRAALLLPVGRNGVCPCHSLHGPCNHHRESGKGSLQCRTWAFLVCQTFVGDKQQVELTSEPWALGDAGCSSIGSIRTAELNCGVSYMGNLGAEGCMSESLGILGVMCVSLAFRRHWGSPNIFEGFGVSLRIVGYFAVSMSMCGYLGTPKGHWEVCYVWVYMPRALLASGCDYIKRFLYTGSCHHPCLTSEVIL